MPPIGRRKYSGPRRPGEKSAKVKKTKAKLKYYSNPMNIAKNSNRLLKIRTLLPKEMKFSIQYRTTLEFSNMGSAPSPGVLTPTLIKINLLDPASHVGPGSSGIVTVVAYGGATTSPLFSTTNPDANLSTVLQEYSDKYDNLFVTGSQAKVRVQPVANQLVGQVLANVEAQGAQPGGANQNYNWDSNHPPYLEVIDPEYDGEVYVWGVKQRGAGNLINANGGLSLHQVRTELPGVQMRKVTSFLNGTSTKAVQLNSTYTPKFLGIKDARDNLRKININADGSERTDAEAKDAYFYVGIMNRQGSTQAKKCANQIVDIVVNYNVLYTNRTNDPIEGDAPIPAPHQGDL